MCGSHHHDCGFEKVLRTNGRRDFNVVFKSYLLMRMHWINSRLHSTKITREKDFKSFPSPVTFYKCNTNLSKWFIFLSWPSPDGPPVCVPRRSMVPSSAQCVMPRSGLDTAEQRAHLPARLPLCVPSRRAPALWQSFAQQRGASSYQMITQPPLS